MRSCRDLDKRRCRWAERAPTRVSAILVNEERGSESEVSEVSVVKDRHVICPKELEVLKR